MALLTNNNKILIKILRLKKGYSAVHMMHEFPQKNWSTSTLCNLIKCIHTTGNYDRKKGSGQLQSVRTAANIQLVSDLICSCPQNFANFDILHIILSHKKNKLTSL